MLKVRTSPLIGSTTTTLYAVADAYVNETSPDTNYGSSDKLNIKFNSNRCFSYIMFDLSPIPLEVTWISAMMKVYAGSGSWVGPFGSVDVGAHYCSDNTWIEGEIVWNNKPSFEDEATDRRSFGMISYEGYKTWDVSNDVKVALSEGKLTEVLKFDSGSSGHMSLSSRESSSKPTLVVEYSTSPVYDVHLESVQNTGETSNLGYIKIEDVFSMLPYNLSVVTGSYQATYQSGYRFVSWETTGGVSVSDPNSQTTTITVSGSGTLRAVGNAETIVYAYDDGSAATSVSRQSGYMIALKFTPIFRGKLERASFYVYSASQNIVKVHILDDQRQDMISSITKTFISQGWFDVDLSEYNIEISSEFYIGIEWTSDYTPSIGGCYVSNLPIETECWIWNGTEWSETYTAPVVRASVTSTIPISVIPTPTPSPTPTPTPSPTPTQTPTASPTPSTTPTSTPTSPSTPIPTSSPTPTSPTPTSTPTPTKTPAPTPTAIPTVTPTPPPSGGIFLPFETVIIIVVAVAAVCVCITIAFMMSRKK